MRPYKKRTLKVTLKKKIKALISAFRYERNDLHIEKKSVLNILRTFNFSRMDSYKQFDCLFINLCEKFENEDESVFTQKVLPGF